MVLERSFRFHSSCWACFLRWSSTFSLVSHPAWEPYFLCMSDSELTFTPERRVVAGCLRSYRERDIMGLFLRLARCSTASTIFYCHHTKIITDSRCMQSFECDIWNYISCVLNFIAHAILVGHRRSSVHREGLYYKLISIWNGINLHFVFHLGRPEHLCTHVPWPPLPW